MTAPYWLDPAIPDMFPPVELALDDPNGLLAVGGDLSVARLLTAYRHGIFPWYSAGQPILWWSPDPRTVLYPDHIHISRSLRKRLRKVDYRISMDNDFSQVMRACAAPRRHQPGTWIVPEMIEAYTALHAAGYAHSIELWQEHSLVGGLYGVALGKVFFGESMFSRIPNASKIVMAHLARQLSLWGFQLLDCQVESQHLLSLGAITIPRNNFILQLDQFCELPGNIGHWHCDDDLTAQLLATLG